MLRLRCLAAFGLISACASSAPLPTRPAPTAVSSAAALSSAPATASASASAAPTPTPVSAPPSTYGANSPEQAVFSSWVSDHKDMTAEQVFAAIGPLRPDPAAPPFDPTTAQYYDQARQALQLQPDEIALFRKRGFVAIDHGQRHSMGSLYHAIYTRDLPVLITTDSILHAMHRSFDGVLMQLESAHFKGALEEVLTSTHQALASEWARQKTPLLQTALQDVDVYLTVARNLLAGLAQENVPFQGLSVHSVLQQDDRALAILRSIASLQMGSIQLYGTEHTIDFSQFRVRGHYTRAPELGMYFRAMMWLGRPDTGFGLLPPPPNSRLGYDANRERVDGAVLALLVRAGGKASTLEALRTYIDFLVGEADDLSVGDLQQVLDRLGVRSIDALAKDDVRSKLVAALERPARPVSQVLGQAAFTSVAPSIVQFFGQSFLIDSFVLGHVVYDTIHFQGSTPQRTMPSGLDVAAALGNNEAVALLEPDLRTYSYGSNLLAARAVVDSYPAGRWQKSVYSRWIDALRVIDDVPTNQARFPQVMTTRAWQRKQLQTQLSSWAELRHDTILYGKQSYGALTCEYPAGFVEPYPLFYARVAELAQEQARLARLPALQKLASNARAPGATPQPGPRQPRQPPGKPTAPAPAAQKQKAPLEEIASFFDSFAATLKKLQTLADRELAGQPFSDEEKQFLKKTVDIRGGGSGPPRYDGWYPTLIYGGSPAAWMPTVADVHTDPNPPGSVLEVAVGDANFLLVAIDNDAEKMVFVGPAYSYYEFSARSDARLKDEEWQGRLASGSAPSAPIWTNWFRTPSHQRTLGAVPGARTAPPGRPPPIRRK